MYRLFDHPSALGIISARATVLVGSHDGVMASRDGVRPESTRARLDTAVARMRAIAAAIGARPHQSL